MLGDERTRGTMSPKRKSLWTPPAEHRPRVVNGVFEAGGRYGVARDGPERRVLVIDSDKERIVATTPLAVGCTVKTRHESWRLTVEHRGHTAPRPTMKREGADGR
jgi:hypothetical protein